MVRPSRRGGVPVFNRPTAAELAQRFASVAAGLTGRPGLVFQADMDEPAGTCR